MGSRIALIFVAASITSFALGQPSEFEPLPDLGDRESASAPSFEEERVGEQLMMQIRRFIPTVSDPILKYFVKTNLYTLAEHSDLTTTDLNYFIIASDELNAFAAPGEIIGINLGLFTFAEDVHQFSSVVAHELAHLSQRHYARREEHDRQLWYQEMLGYLASAAILAAGGRDAFLGGLAVNSHMSDAIGFSYSRSQEHEADRIGFNSLTKAGFDPQGAVNMFRRMKDHYRYDMESSHYDFLRTHPVTDDRISDLRSMVGEETEHNAQAVSIATVAAEYQLMRVRVAHRQFITAKEAMEHANSLEGESIADKYDIALALVRNEEYIRAIELMEDVLYEMPNSILVIACFADLLVDAGQAERALRILDNALSDTPRSEPLTVVKAKALRKLERYAAATRLFRKLVQQSSEDIDLWFELAETAGQAKDIHQVHRARAEFYALRGQYGEAIQNLQYAKQHNTGKSERVIEINEIALDQRIKEMREAAELAGAEI